MDFSLIPSNYRFEDCDNRLLDLLKEEKKKYYDSYVDNLIYDRDYENYLFSDRKQNKTKSAITGYNTKFNNVINPHNRLKDKYFIKKYDDDNIIKYKLIYMPSVSAKNVELLEDEKNFNSAHEVQQIQNFDNYKYDKKLESSLLRSKRVIYDLAFSNDWQYFLTGTINPENYDTKDLDRFHKDFTQWIGNLNKHHNYKIKFLVIPEKHKSGAWHLHGFLGGVPDKILESYERENYYPFTEKRLPVAILRELERGNSVYKLKPYEKKFGWCTLTKIRDKESISAYCMKYITKDLLQSVTKVGAHSYFRSRGLKLPQVVYTGTMDNVLYDSLDFDVENDFCKIKWLSEDDIKFFMR